MTYMSKGDCWRMLAHAGVFGEEVGWTDVVPLRRHFGE